MQLYSKFSSIGLRNKNIHTLTSLFIVLDPTTASWQYTYSTIVMKVQGEFRTSAGVGVQGRTRHFGVVNRLGPQTAILSSPQAVRAESAAIWREPTESAPERDHHRLFRFSSTFSLYNSNTFLKPHEQYQLVGYIQSN